mmetsp:Transcript_39218/g.70229  ORF Transcript_39218/g.70229 Transcript_39218/m.70229 type:complete len:125 (+) Transcript_39218:66-440(+)
MKAKNTRINEWMDGMWSLPIPNIQPHGHRQTQVLSFQLLASVALPGFTINRWVLFLGLCAEEYDHLVAHLDPVILEWLPTLGGLALIPLIVRPLDFLVERALELILEPYLHKQFPRCTVTPQLE